jgi:hypothetical protein
MVWPSGEWALRTPAQAYLCIGGFGGSVASVLPSGGPLSVEPVRFTVPQGGGVLPVTITATARGSTTLWLRLDSTAGKPEVQRSAALVVADGERWHFEKAD